MHKNKQLPSPMIRDSGRSLIIHSIFLTIQGEGPFVGTPAVFLRLAGCNIQCPGCDTDYMSNQEELPVEDIANRISKAAINVAKLVVITGGEPFRQPIGPLVNLLSSIGFKVQVETNGMILRSMGENVQWKNMIIVCSPKTPQINREMAFLADAFKYIIQAGNVCPDDGLPLTTMGWNGGKLARPPFGSEAEIFIQPLDEGDPENNRANLQAAIDSCMKFGYRLCLQTHKLCNLP